MNRPSSVSTLTAGPGERVLEVLDFHVCAGEPCATVVLEPIDGFPALECCIPVDQLHVHTVAFKATVAHDRGCPIGAPLPLGSQEKVPGAGKHDAA